MTIGVVGGVVQMALLARGLGPAGVGMLGLFVAATAVFGGVFRSNSAEAAITFVSRALASDPRRVEGTVALCYAADLLTSAGAFCALLAFAPFAGVVGVSGGSRALLCAYGLTLLALSTYWVSHALLRVTDRFGWTFVQTACSVVLKTVGIAGVLYAGGGLRAVVALLVACAFVDGVSMYLLARAALLRRGVVRGALGPAWRDPPEGFWRFVFLGQGRGVVKTLSRYLDMLVIGALMPATQVGLYRAARQMTDQLQLPAQALVSSLYPEYSRLWFAGERARLRRLVARSSAGLAALGVCLVAAVWLAGAPVVRLLLGDAFLPAQGALVVLVLATALNIVMTPIYSVPTAAGRGGPPLLASVVAAVAQFTLMFFLIPAWGIVGAAWSNVAFIAVWTLVLLPMVVSLLGRSAPRTPPAGAAAPGRTP
jgi:O-antigen/teichoic acid export membrane protein